MLDAICLILNIKIQVFIKHNKGSLSLVLVSSSVEDPIGPRLFGLPGSGKNRIRILYSQKTNIFEFSLYRKLSKLEFRQNNFVSLILNVIRFTFGKEMSYTFFLLNIKNT